MKPTIEYLQIHFAKYNEKYFYSKLPMPSFELMNTVSTLGCYCPPTKEHGHLIRMTEAYEEKERFFQKTLIHEMIHYYLNYIGDNDTGWARHHGNNFMREADRINKDSWRIRRLCSDNEMRMVRLIPTHVSFRVTTPFIVT